MTKNAKPLAHALCSATAALLRAQELVKHPENREKLIRAELETRMVMLAEFHDDPPKPAGHHGG